MQIRVLYRQLRGNLDERYSVQSNVAEGGTGVEYRVLFPPAWRLRSLLPNHASAHSLAQPLAIESSFGCADNYTNRIYLRLGC